MENGADPAALLERLELREYEATAIEHLLSIGRTTAPHLSEATGIPKARIYDVLDSLADRGFVKVIPGRPKEYQPKAPGEILARAEENYRQEFETRRATLDEIRDAFLAAFEPRFERSSEDITPTEELFWVVDVGEPSERETRALYHDAEERVHVLTKSFEYFDRVEPAVRDALDRGIDVRALFLTPDQLEPRKQERQAEIVDRFREEYPGIDRRFSGGPLPFRGTFVDPSMDYSTGKAILLVEEEDVPNFMRQAAVTENGSFVAGMKRYFDLIWAHDSVEEYPG